MKRLFTLILSTISVFSLFSQDVDLQIIKLQNTPVIDGIVDDSWEEVSKNEVATQITGDFGDASMTCWFKMAYVDTALFVMVSRIDDDFANEYITKLQNWQSDRDELFFDVHIDTLLDGRGASNGQNGAYYGHYQFTSIFAADSAVAKHDTVLYPQQWYHNKPYTIGYDFKGQIGYTAEYFFPFTSLVIDTTYLKGVNPLPLVGDKVGKVFAFCLSMSDVDMADSPTDETYRKWLRWEPASHCDAWNNMDSAAYIEFIESCIDCDTIIDSIIKVDENFNSSYRWVYPNLVKNEIWLAESVEKISIYNISGQQITTAYNIMKNETIDVSFLKSGVYFIRINDEITSRFIKQ